MNTGWSPKPLRPLTTQGIFSHTEEPVVVKSLSPMQKQRLKDGTPPTVSGRTDLRPADPEIQLSLVKSSLAEKMGNKNRTPDQEPLDPLSVVKSYLVQESVSVAKSHESHAKSVNSMQKSLEALNVLVGTKTPS